MHHSTANFRRQRCFRPITLPLTLAGLVAIALAWPNLLADTAIAGNSPPPTTEDQTEPDKTTGKTGEEQESRSTKSAPDEKPAARDAAPEPQFVRIRKDGKSDQPIALDTAIVRYAIKHNGQTVTVDLVGAVHIGEKSYYEELNRRLARYDAVLYELVAPKGTRIPKGGKRSTHPLSLVQQGMTRILELEFQLEQVDYSPQTFIHADLSPREFAQSMKDRDESLWKFLLKAMKVSMKQQLASDDESDRPPSDLEILRALLAKDRALQLKRLMAGQLANMKTQMEIFAGTDGSTIITERNKRALDVLREQLDKGKQRVAIFYGAGHLPDMDERLLADFQAKRESTDWLTAWKMED